MATIAEVRNDPKYIQVHEHGFVGLVDYMGTDSSIVQAARVSYGVGTKTPSTDRNLIRYMLRHKHTSPFEMCEVKFHIKLPIFVMRQLIRQRTANTNEYSARYSEMPNEFYMPAIDDVKPQSTNNKQGRSGSYSAKIVNFVRDVIGYCFKETYSSYENLIHEDNFEGEGPLAKELARIVLPVANYTECYWKIDLHNLFNFLRLRLDAHAQKEIRDFAEAIYKLVQPLFPVACEAFEDYINQAKTLSRMEIQLIKTWMNPDGANIVDPESAGGFCSTPSLINYAKDLGMTEREIDEFIQFWIPTRIQES